MASTATEALNRALSHHGIKGQRWGVRRTRAQIDGGGGSDVTVKQVPGKSLRTSGGKGRPAHEDAKRAAANKQLAKSSGTASLSNKELQDLITRINAEQNYSRLTAPKKGYVRTTSEKFIKDLLENELRRLANDPVAEINRLNKGRKAVKKAVRRSRR